MVETLEGEISCSDQVDGIHFASIVASEKLDEFEFCVRVSRARSLWQVVRVQAERILQLRNRHKHYG